jgi:RNA polymerase sigma-70 factor, ECF subfamily
MMPPEMTSAQQDESAVTAVRGGDAERYRELVERHERRVYAVAWSRLGDAALAEEATQEAFIRAYRRLWLLGDGAKFSGWVNTIVRRVAINSGLRHRRELNKRERWALDNPAISAEENSANETDPLHTPETLRQTLAELPDSHRECLVLFYLEGKSGAEAAAALGISEAALRVRLHRARAAMRERLEEKLEGSLANLRPAKTLVSAIMAGVLATSSAKAATAGGIGAAIFGTLAKFTPFKWLFAFFAFIPLLLPVVMILPALFFQRWQRRDERRNYRDQKGFRANLHRQFDQSYLVFFVFLISMILFFATMTTHVFGTKDLFLVIGLFTLVAAVFAVRQLEINCGWFQIGFLFCNLLMPGFYLCIGLGWLPITAVFPAIMISTLFTVLANPGRFGPLRMDYNLFLRATQGMLPPSDLPTQEKSSIRFNRAALRAFARFLGERRLVNNFCWRAGGLTLYLPAVKSPLTTTWNRIFPTVRNNSNITLGWDGSVAARCGKKDAAGLAILRSNFTSDPAQFENQVALAVSQAWRNFRDGKTALAERAIGQISEAEIFVVPPGRTRANRWQRIFVGGFMALASLLLAVGWLFPERLSGLKPINLTEAQVREFLSHVAVNTNPIVKAKDGPGYTQKGTPWDPWEPLFLCLILPGTNLFTPQGLQAVHLTILGSDDLEKWRQNPKRLQLFMNSQHHRAIYESWLSWPQLNLQPADCEAFLHTNSSSIYSGALMGLGTNWNFFLSRCAAWSWVKSQHYDVMRIQNWGVWDLRFLSEVNSLDLVDREKLIQQIADVQTLSANPPGNPPIHDWRDVRGLFFTPCFPALQDTYNSLAALEILGGLDRIDREACIEGILKRHEGKGYFTSPSSGSYNEYHIDGSARDTIAAFESLRILGALDRVKDLDKWQFRVADYNSSKPDAHGIRVLTWDEIEAWVAQQRLEKILREHKEHPSAPFDSLLDP